MGRRDEMGRDEHVMGRSGGERRVECCRICGPAMKADIDANLKANCVAIFAGLGVILALGLTISLIVGV